MRSISSKLSFGSHYMSPPCSRHRLRREYISAGRWADHVRLVLRIILTEIFLDVLVRHPTERPHAGPRPRVCPRIVHQHFVAQGVEIWTRILFCEAQGLRVRQAAV